MLLQYLIENLTNVKVTGENTIDINKIEYDSKKIEEGDVFVAIRGYEEDGNTYIEEAIERGAKCVVLEEGSYDVSSIKDKATILEVENSRIALAIISATSKFKLKTYRSYRY